MDIADIAVGGHSVRVSKESLPGHRRGREGEQGRDGRAYQNLDRYPVQENAAIPANIKLDSHNVRGIGGNAGANAGAIVDGVERFDQNNDGYNGMEWFGKEGVKPSRKNRWKSPDSYGQNNDRVVGYGNREKQPSPFSDNKIGVKAEKFDTGKKGPLLTSLDGKDLFPCLFAMGNGFLTWAIPLRFFVHKTHQHVLNCFFS